MWWSGSVLGHDGRLTQVGEVCMCESTFYVFQFRLGGLKNYTWILSYIGGLVALTPALLKGEEL